MASKSQRKTRQTETTEPSESPALWNLVAFAVALLAILTPLVCGEGAPEQGAELWLASGWFFTLALWSFLFWSAPNIPLRWSYVETWLSAFLAWLVVSTIAISGEGNIRAAFNSLFDYTQLLVAYFLFRQLLVESKMRHTMVVLMVAIATGVSTFAIYQYAVVTPANRLEYQAHPEEILIANGIDPTPNNPMRILFESRLNSTEPTGTFTLTNSLAGFLVPWLLLAIGFLLPSWKTDRVQFGAILFAVCLVSICLLLTKSRTAWLSTLFGLALLGTYGSSIGKWVSWKVPVIGLSTVLSLFMLAFAVGVLDVEVLSEAPKSVVYRLQYWQGASAIIAERPIFGCGLGNFQGYYPQHMLPMASETIADPHNFIFEVWAAAGTPAMLCLAMAIGSWIWIVARKTEEDPDSQSATPSIASSAILVGGLAGFLLAPLMRMIMHQTMLEFDLIFVGILPIMVVLGLVALRQSEDLLTQYSLPIAAAAMLINLLAAGGISFPGVAISLLLVAALAMPSRQTARNVSPSMKLAPLLVSVGLMASVTFLGIRPVIAKNSEMSLAQIYMNQQRYADSLQHAKAANNADTWSKQPSAFLANLYFFSWVNTNPEQTKARDSYYACFEEHIAEAIRRSGRSFPLHSAAGNWYLEIYRRSGKQAALDQAIHHYQMACEYFPARSMHHAQLAWTFHLAENRKESLASAKEALRLDALNPHFERQLDQLKIYDAPPESVVAEQPPPPAEEFSAQQVMQLLRTIK